MKNSLDDVHVIAIEKYDINNLFKTMKHLP